ncbi:hypothetical protein ACSAGD_01230 [Paramicrobacterium sp. CJ85]|uniref:hypothetical protein n=1 Tax=Paramicrobacterium sp. CJ85 TaxID=3445355 RepID=UPI003F5EE6FC
MARYTWVAIPAAALIAAGIWVCADALTEPTVPNLGPAVHITPTGDPDDIHTTPPPTVTPDEGATTVPPAPPRDAGDDDHDDDVDDDDDDDDWDDDDD